MDYVRLAATSLRLLEEHGQDVSLRRIGASVYNAATQTNTPAAPVDEPRFGAEFPLEGQHMFQGSLVEINDTKLLLDPDGAEPSTKDKLILGDGTVKNIVSSKPLSPAGTPVLYTLHLRAA